MATFLGAIGVPHYTKDGKLYTGAMHKDASGRLMTGKFHTANSQFLFHNRNGMGAIGQALKYYRVVFRILRSGSYLEDAFVQATDAKEARKLGEKIIRNNFRRTKMEFVEVREVK